MRGARPLHQEILSEPGVSALLESYFLCSRIPSFEMNFYQGEILWENVIGSIIPLSTPSSKKERLWREEHASSSEVWKIANAIFLCVLHVR